jgi:predicted AAA+ superfamily ATPase
MDTKYIKRQIELQLHAALKRGKSVLLLGPRQTGKTTLISQIPAQLTISFINPAVRQRYEQNPSLLIGEVEVLAMQHTAMPIIILDEIQKVPAILDSVQDLIDRKLAQFILTGSSARKLRQGVKLNLLPGRVVVLRLDPLTYAEIINRSEHAQTSVTLLSLLTYGTLPGIFTNIERKDSIIDLQSYVSTYLEEEIRAEALVRNIAAFGKFLALAADESGELVNFSKLSQQIGVAHTTIASYYQILEDCLIAERVEPFINTKVRRKLIRTPKYLLFDLGVKQACAQEYISPRILGKLFEHWIGLELIRYARLNANKTKIYFWRDADGPEIDWLICKNDCLIPIEVKLTDTPSLHDAKHLRVFMQEYANVNDAYIVCQAVRKAKIADNIYALPWQALPELFLDACNQ